MRLDAFDFDLPPSSIARRPRADRDRARLLVLDRRTGAVEHHRVGDLPHILDPGDRVVLNDSRVVPSAVSLGGDRVSFGRDPTTRAWTARGLAADVVHPDRAGMAPVGAAAALAHAEPRWVERQLAERGAVTWPRYLQHLEPRPGDAPVPAWYGNVYARVPGSVAPPSGGINLSATTLDRLEASGVGLSTVTLHVGHVTFRRPTAERIQDHRMEGERFALPGATSADILATRAAGGRVIAVGTTTTRTLEHAAARGGLSRLDRVGVADLFITPGHRFAAVDGLLTGFHAPRSTLLVLVCALGGREAVLEAYREAVAEGYRWYTLGDSMLIV